MSESVIAMRFTKQVLPYQWRAESPDVPGVAGLGDSIVSALKSWQEQLPNTLTEQRVQIETMTKRLADARLR